MICVLILGVYLLQKSCSPRLETRRTQARQGARGRRSRLHARDREGRHHAVEDRPEATQEKLVAAERRADENARKFDLLAREIDFGLMIFDAEGFIAFSNPLVRKLLAVDTWSRRRYGEIFHDIPVLSKLIGECFETGAETRKKTIEFQG